MKRPPINESPLSDRDLKFLQMGRAATIPGFQHAIELLQKELTQTKTEMYSIQTLLAQRMQQADGIGPMQQNNGIEHRQLSPASAPKKRGRPRKNPEAIAEFVARSAGSKGYWASMTKEERSAEMARRQTMRAKKKTKKLHPRNVEHPDHERWKANVTKAMRKAWKGYSPAERKQRIQKALAGRGLAQTPAVILGRTA